MLPNTLQQQGEPICAVATPLGRGALTIVRLSGQDALAIAEKVTHKKPVSRYASFTKFFDDNGQVIDQGIVIWFQAPASFTGEDVVEFHCHGNPIVSDLLLNTLCAHGSRLATPGEFSQRAFVNNKIDLTQAEAIADLITCTTEQGVRTATRSLQGAFSVRVQDVLSKLILMRTNIEAQLDFPDEEIEVKHSKQIASKLQELNTEIAELVQQAQQGERLQTGVTIAIAGSPNAGKSSLINALAQSEIAIVTEIPGTTRDPLTADIDIQGIPVRLIDTAGLRATKDVIEQKGIERAQQALSQADIILWLSDVSQTQQQNPPHEIEQSKIIFVHNKIDLTNLQAGVNKNQIHLSVKTGAGLQDLIDMLTSRLFGKQQGDSPFLARRRHLIALQQAREHIAAALQHIGGATNIELAAEDLRLAQQALGEITGEFTSDDLLGRIFSEFCLGK